MSDQLFDQLMRDYTLNRLTGDDLQRFLDMAAQEPYKQTLQDYISQLLHEGSASGLADNKRAAILFENIMAAARAHSEPAPVYPMPVERSVRKLPVRWIAAALLIAVCIPAVWMLTRQPAKPPVAVIQPAKKQSPADVLPGGQKALLTLGDGTVIALDDAANGTLAKQGATTVIKLNGKLGYKAGNSGAQQPVYNTISTPRGGQYQVELPDGSMVWLNAASSIRFPTAFASQERKVDITGEAYFEVAKKSGQPFVVAVNGSEVRVKGTHFNVMAYTDEATLETTLFEGAVDFSYNNHTISLKPSEQSRLQKDGKLDMTSELDLEDVLAWKNGMFHFENADIRTVMRQLSRWYDVDVEYRTTPDDSLYHVEMPRASKLSSVLKVLEIAASIHFTIEGKKIIVT